MFRFYITMAFIVMVFSASTASAQYSEVDRQVAHCNDFYADIDADRYADIAASVDTSGEQKSLSYELTYKQKERRECLARGREFVKSNPALAAQFDAVISQSDAYLVDRFAKARSEFEANVVKYINPADYFGEPRTAPYKAALNTARKMPSFKSMCGSFDFGWVPIEVAAVNAARSRHEAFKTCYNKYQSEVSRISVNEFISFQGAAKRLTGTRLYTCAQWRRPNCVPDAEWKRFGGELFTPKNRALVDEAEKRLDADRKASYDIERKVNEWVRDLSSRINATKGG